MDRQKRIDREPKPWYTVGKRKEKINMDLIVVRVEKEELPWILLRARAAFLSREIIGVHEGQPCKLYYADLHMHFEIKVNVTQVEIKRVSELNDYDAASLGYGNLNSFKEDRKLEDGNELVMIVRFVL